MAKLAGEAGKAFTLEAGNAIGTAAVVAGLRETLVDFFTARGPGEARQAVARKGGDAIAAAAHVARIAGALIDVYLAA